MGSSWDAVRAGGTDTLSPPRRRGQRRAAIPPRPAAFTPLPLRRGTAFGIAPVPGSPCRAIRARRQKRRGRTQPPPPRGRWIQQSNLLRSRISARRTFVMARVFLLAGLIGVCAVAGVALAQGGGGPPPPA